LDSVNAQPLAGTEGAAYPFWSPNSRSVGFFADGKLKRIDLQGGAVQALAGAGLGLGGAWDQNDVVFFLGASSIFRVAAGGGPVAQVTHLDAPRASVHIFPYFLPDGRHFVFYVRAAPEIQGLYLGDLESNERVRLFNSDSAAVYSSGYLLFIRQSTLFAHRFDAARRQLSGDPFPIAPQAALDAGFNAGAISDANGVLGFRTGCLSGCCDSVCV